MTSDAKVGMLLGLVFIFIIAFLVNGFPSFIEGANNNELENLEKLLDAAPKLLKQGGRIAVISFHSLEDRLVKNNFKQNQKEGVYKVITRKPLVPERGEIAKNRRARSAKLRIAERQ